MNFLNFFKKKKKEEIPNEIFPKETISISDIIAPPAFEVKPTMFRLGERIAKTFFVFSYPRYLNAAWLSPIINLDAPLDISLYIYPVPTHEILRQLAKKVTEVQVEINEREEKGLIRDPALEIGYQDLEELRDKLQTAQERMFRLGIYITIYGKTEKEIKTTETILRQILESRIIYSKQAAFQQKEGFITVLPYLKDKLGITTAMNTEPLSSIFPFVSFTLSSDKGILYGINRFNNSLIIFDRFSLENANVVIFAKSGSGKSYFQKLEILRYLMLGVDVIVIDPENEYEPLAQALGGSFFKISLSSDNHINPFDLPLPLEGEKKEDILRASTINLVGLFRIMLSGLSPEEDAILDKAITETYILKDITPKSDFSKITPPLMSDLEEVLKSMEGTESLLERLQKYTSGTYAKFFNNYTNIDTKNRLVIFGIRDMETELKPMAMYIILRYIWNLVRSSLKKRILVVDEAWWMMQNEDGASFLYGIAKRGRKYWLGTTTITQDVIDFMKSSYGQPIINNSSLQILLKQSPATIDLVAQTFNLTEGEKQIILECAVGEGLFFAGMKHVPIKVIASEVEDKIITTSPEEIIKLKEEKLLKKIKKTED